MSVAILDALGAPTGQTFPTQTKNDRGEFELTVSGADGVSVVIEATGYHYNEVTGVLSSSALTLRSIATLSAGTTQSVFVNVFTHLAAGRIKNLAASGGSIAQSSAIAERQLRAALAIAPPDFGAGVAGSQMSLLGGSSDANTYLFAVSVILEQAAVLAAATGGSVDAELQQLINLVAADFADDGAIQSTLGARLREAERAVNIELVTRSFARRLAQVGSSAEVPDLNRALDTDGDGVPNASDPCPLQAGVVPSADGEMCLQAVKLLDFGPVFVGPVGGGPEEVLATGTGSESVLVGRLAEFAGPGQAIALSWLGGNDGGEAMRVLRMSDGGTPSSAFRVAAVVRRPGEVAVGTWRDGCATVVSVSREGVSREDVLACDAGTNDSMALVADSSGQLRAFWRGTTPANSQWTAFSSASGFAAASVLCAECAAVSIVGGPGGEAAAAWHDTSGTLHGHRIQWSESDGGWSAPEVLPFDASPTMVVDGNGNLLAVWHLQSGNGSETMWSSHQSDAGWSLSAPVDSLVGHSLFSPLLVGTASGDAVATWLRRGDAGYDVIGSTYTPGVGWAPAIQFGKGGYSVYPYATQSSGRYAIVSWGSSPEGHAVSIRRFELQRGWRPAQVLPRVANTAQFALSESGEVRLVWSEQDRGGIDFYTGVLK